MKNIPTKKSSKIMTNKLTQSFDSDYLNFLKENEEEQSILNSHFTKKSGKEKESFDSLLKYRN